MEFFLIELYLFHIKSILYIFTSKITCNIPYYIFDEFKKNIFTSQSMFFFYQHDLQMFFGVTCTVTSPNDLFMSIAKYLNSILALLDLAKSSPTRFV